MGLFDKLTSKPPKYTATAPAQTNNNNNNNNSNSNPYPTTSNQNQAQQVQQPQNYYPTTDDRPLPDGWQKQWHEGYGRFFYIDTRHPSGPQSHWVHPADQQAGHGYSAPLGAPQPGYGPQPVSQQPALQAANNRRPGVNPLLAGAGGLAGGMLLGSMLGGGLHHHHDGYMDGYENGYENGLDDGERYNGGDFGGDDYGDDFGGGDFF